MLPGPYPKTPEERAAAAKKYNMRVEDYEPYPDDGMGWGREGWWWEKAAGLGGSTLTLFPKSFRDPSVNGVGAFLGGGRWEGTGEQLQPRGLQFFPWLRLFPQMRKRGFNSSLENPWIAGTFLGSIQSAKLHLDWASAGLRCCHPVTWRGWSSTPVKRTLFVDGILYMYLYIYLSFKRQLYC